MTTKIGGAMPPILFDGGVRLLIELFEWCRVT